MAVVAPFGKFTGTVVPKKGTPVPHHFDEQPVNPSELKEVTELINVWLDELHLQGFQVTCPVPCNIVIKLEGAVIWRDRIGPVIPRVGDDWPDSEYIAAPGEKFTVEVEHNETVAVNVSGNLKAFRR